MIVRDVCAVVDEWAPPGYAYDWDRVGLRIGDGNTDLTGVVVTLTVTPDCVRTAKKKGANLIVSHHAPIWNPLKKLDMGDPETRLWVDIAASGMSVYAAHTNLDITPEGVNDVLAGLLGLTEQRPLFPVAQARLVKMVTFVPDTHIAEVRDAMAQAGAGIIGNYSACSFSSGGVGTFLPNDAANPYSGKRSILSEEPERRLEMQLPEAIVGRVVAAMRSAHPYEEPAYDVYPLQNADTSIGIGVLGVLPQTVTLRECAEYVRTALEIQHVRMVGPGKRKVRRVGVLGGAGGSFLPDLPGDVDVYVTGDVSYHEAQAALDRGVAVVDAGHHGTERWIVPYAVERLKQALPGVSIVPFLEPDPFEAVLG